MMKKKYILPQIEVIYLESQQPLLGLSEPLPPSIESRDYDFWDELKYHPDDYE